MWSRLIGVLLLVLMAACGGAAEPAAAPAPSPGESSGTDPPTTEMTTETTIADAGDLERTLVPALPGAAVVEVRRPSDRLSHLSVLCERTSPFRTLSLTQTPEGERSVRFEGR